MYCNPKNVTSGEPSPVRASRKEYTCRVVGGYCSQCDSLYESVRSGKADGKLDIDSLGSLEEFNKSFGQHLMFWHELNLACLQVRNRKPFSNSEIITGLDSTPEKLNRKEGGTN